MHAAGGVGGGRANSDGGSKLRSCREGDFDDDGGDGLDRREAAEAEPTKPTKKTSRDIKPSASVARLETCGRGRVLIDPRGKFGEYLERPQKNQRRLCIVFLAKSNL